MCLGGGNSDSPSHPENSHRDFLVEVDQVGKINARAHPLDRFFKGDGRGTGTERACKKAEPAGEATTQPEDAAKVTLDESLRDRQSWRVRKRGNEVETNYNNIDRNVALSKIQALTGMVLAQEEIEILLCQELDELKNKQAENEERLWRLMARYSN